MAQTAAQRAWYERNREAIIARRLERYRANADAEREAMRVYYEEHRDVIREQQLEYYLTHQPAMVSRQASRRALKREAFVEHVDRQLVWERDEGVCGICGEAAEPDDWHLDHIVPLIRGGEHSYANVRVTHSVCNTRKGARIEEVCCLG